MNTENRGKSYTKSKSNLGKSRSKLRGRGQVKSDMSSIQCWNCDEYGHYKSQCKALIKDKKDHREKKTANATIDDTGDVLILSVSSPFRVVGSEF